MKKSGLERLHPTWWALILVVAVGVFAFATMSRFLGTFRSEIPVVVASERAGLVMEPGAKVKLRGVQVGRVSDIRGGYNSVHLDLGIDPDQIKHIPANVAARIRAATVFGAKYVDLVYPDNPSPARLRAGTVITSQNVSTEVNTVFENVVDLLRQIDPAKLNGILSALSEGLRGQGPRIGEATTDANQVLEALNSHTDALDRDWRSLRGFSNTYGKAAKDLLIVLDAASTTSTTITSQSADLNALLLDAIGLSNSGIALLGPAKNNLIAAVNDLEPTTALLAKYNPELTCTIKGGYTALTEFPLDEGNAGKNGSASVASVGLQLGNDPYKYPDNLPIIGAKGGPGGRPGCGSLPDVSKNWPVRQLVTNTGWGTGVDWRPNPGIGFPGWANFFPVTKGTPEPPRIRYPGGPAPGPPPSVPGGAPYGAPWYAPDGAPLYPGLPAGVPSDTLPPDPSHPPPGAEPFAPAAAPHPTPTPTNGPRQ